MTGLVHVTPADGELYLVTIDGYKDLALVTDKPVHGYIVKIDQDDAGSPIVSAMVSATKSFISDDSLKECLKYTGSSDFVGSLNSKYRTVVIYNRAISGVDPSELEQISDPDAFDLWLPVLDIDRLAGEYS